MSEGQMNIPFGVLSWKYLGNSEVQGYFAICLMNNQPVGTDPGITRDSTFLECEEGGSTREELSYLLSDELYNLEETLQREIRGVVAPYLLPSPVAIALNGIAIAIAPASNEVVSDLVMMVGEYDFRVSIGKYPFKSPGYVQKEQQEAAALAALRQTPRHLENRLPPSNQQDTGIRVVSSTSSLINPGTEMQCPSFSPRIEPYCEK